MSRDGSGFRKFLFWMVGGIVVLELIWLLGANWALSSELVVGAINKKPEKLEVRWGGAKTYIPGVIHVQDLSVRGTSKRQQWHVALDRVRVHMALLSLPFKTFRTYDVQGEDLVFTLSKRGGPAAETAPESSQDEAGVNEVAAGDVDTQKKKSKRPWRFGLRDIHIKGSESISVLGYELSGQGTIDADLALELKGGPLSLDRTRINLEQAQLEVQGERAAHDLIIALDIALAPFVPKKVQGSEVLGSMSGRVGIKGQTQGAGVINRLLSRFQDFEVGSPGGLMDADLRFEQGVLIPQSRLSLKASGGWIRLAEWTIDSALEVGISVDSKDKDGTKLTLAVEGVEVDAEGAEGPVLEGANVNLMASSPGIDFSKGLEELGEAFDTIAVDLTDAVVADITRFPIPEVEGFSLRDGTISVESHFTSTPDLAKGDLHVAGQGIDSSFDEIGLVGDLEIDINIQSSDPHARDFKVEASVINIDNVTMTKGDMEANEKDENWYVHLKLLDGTMHVDKPRSISANVEIGMRDTRPIISVLVQDKSVLNLFKGMLNFKDLVGTAGMDLTREMTDIKDLDIDSEGLKVKANMRIGEDGDGGIMWVKFHGINLGVDMRGGKTDVRFKKPLKWYEEQSASWSRVETDPKAAVAN